jgi:hypothetical protein
MNLALLTDEQLLELGRRHREKQHRYMESYAAGSPGALRYGWDWPTFCALFASTARVWGRLKSEYRRRHPLEF